MPTRATTSYFAESLFNSALNLVFLTLHELMHTFVPLESCWCVCCLPYYLFCCCFFCKAKGFTSSKPDFIKRFSTWMNVKASKSKTSGTDRDPIPCLIKLYSCEPDAVSELTTCRLNPDLNSPVRKDLEFFIP